MPTYSRPRGRASLVAGSLDKTIVKERAVLPWSRPTIGPEIAGGSSNVPAGNDEARGRDKEPGEPCDESVIAGCGNATQGNIAKARRRWGRE